MIQIRTDQMHVLSPRPGPIPVVLARKILEVRQIEEAHALLIDRFGFESALWSSDSGRGYLVEGAGISTPTAP